MPAHPWLGCPTLAEARRQATRLYGASASQLRWWQLEVSGLARPGAAAPPTWQVFAFADSYRHERALVDELDEGLTHVDRSLGRVPAGFTFTALDTPGGDLRRLLLARADRRRLKSPEGLPTGLWGMPFDYGVKLAIHRLHATRDATAPTGNSLVETIVGFLTYLRAEPVDTDATVRPLEFTLAEISAFMPH